MKVTLGRLAATLLLCCGLLGPPTARAQEATTAAETEQPPAAVAAGENAVDEYEAKRAEQFPPMTPPASVRYVDLVFAIDCSGSMNGAFRRAKEAIFALVKENRIAYPNAEYRFGMVLYGDGERRYLARGFFDESAFVRVLRDAETEKRARAEYVGMFLEKALTLKWNTRPDTLKRIYVLGNEPADQDHYQNHFSRVLQQTRARGIIVSGVYCSSPERPLLIQGELGDAREYVRQELHDKKSWLDLTERGGGTFYQIAYGPGDIVAFGWTPRQFGAQLKAMETDDYLRQVIAEQQYYPRQLANTRDSRYEVMARLYARREQNVAEYLIGSGAHPVRLYPPAPAAPPAGDFPGAPVSTSR